MQVELLISKMLHVPVVQDIVSDRIALARLPHNSAYPAIVYNVVNDVPHPMVNYQGATLHKSRIQINPLSHNIGEIKKILEAVNQSLNFVQNVFVGESLVVWSRCDLVGPMDKEDESGIWTQSVDYNIDYYPKV